MKIVYNDIEMLLDMENDEIRSLYNIWDKGDCSIVGLTRILMIQTIVNEIKKRDAYYDGEYDEILKALYEKY